MRKLIYLLGLCVICLTSCVGEVTSEEFVPEEPIRMPIYLSISAEEPGMQSRGLGDPGEGDGLQLPTYLYVFFVEHELTSDGKLAATGALDRMEERLNPDAWEYDAPTKRYVYKGNLAMYLSRKEIAETGQTDGTKNTGKSWVYAVTSCCPLTFDAPMASGKINAILTSVEGIKLDETRQREGFDLLNVYSNPKGDPDNGKVIKRGKFLYETDVTCYHVAARIDIQWDVNPEKHGEHWLTEIKVPEVPTEGFLFKHSANKKGTKTVTVPLNPGNQWYGRYVFHTFDKKSVTCQYTVNGIANPINKTYTPGETGSQGVASDVFASWYRINASFGYPQAP